MKSELFKEELNYIKNDRIKNGVKILIDNLPDYFFEVPASSTGKYHPEYASGERGLLRHTKAVVRLGYEILSTETFGDNYTSDQKDLMIVSMLLHDSIKHGINHDKYVKFEHPLLACEYIDNNSSKTELTETELFYIKEGIKTHMGQWNVDYKGNEVLPKPQNGMQRIIHLADLLASKKFIKIEFDKDDNII